MWHRMNMKKMAMAVGQTSRILLLLILIGVVLSIPSTSAAIFISRSATRIAVRVDRALIVPVLMCSFHPTSQIPIVPSSLRFLAMRVAATQDDTLSWAFSQKPILNRLVLLSAVAVSIVQVVKLIIVCSLAHCCFFVERMMTKIEDESPQLQSRGR